MSPARMVVGTVAIETSGWDSSRPGHGRTEIYFEVKNVSFDKKSPRSRIPESFRVERLESRVLLSADPVLTPLAAALMPHAMHVAALPHAATAQQLGFAVQMAMFNAEALH